MIDRILSSVVSSRKIVFTYGDCATPTYMYREEEGIITTVSESIDAANSKIGKKVADIFGSFTAFCTNIASAATTVSTITK